jgi:hypothetical protein
MIKTLHGAHLDSKTIDQIIACWFMKHKPLAKGICGNLNRNYANPKLLRAFEFVWMLLTGFAIGRVSR